MSSGLEITLKLLFVDFKERVDFDLFQARLRAEEEVEKKQLLDVPVQMPDFDEEETFALS